jgi:Transglutaminase-like superfamily
MKRVQYYLLLALTSILFAVNALGRERSLGKDTLTALQQSKPYNRKLSQTFPEFTYECADDSALSHLREKYHLNTVAGKGTDVERIIKLLAWLHEQLPHEDGPAAATLTAENMIENYHKTGHSQGCYGLAISLNEVLLSVGYKSRVVICFSNQYPAPRGGHVINTVYVPSLTKWIYIDPQENAYIKDEKGNLLSIAEVRERLVKRQPLVLNPTANYHGVPTKKSEYLDQFMGEHLYRMICPVNSAYNMETRDGKEIKYVELLPYGSIEPPSEMVETQFTKTQSVICYHTSNDQLFWQSPIEVCTPQPVKVQKSAK